MSISCTTALSERSAERWAAKTGFSFSMLERVLLSRAAGELAVLLRRC